jgi:hypothetical protein
MATSIRTHLVGCNENEHVSQKGAARCVTGEHGTGRIVAKLWDLVKLRTAPIREVKKSRPLENLGTGSVQCLPVCWTDVFHDPSVWKDLREMVIGDEADFVA